MKKIVNLIFVFICGITFAQTNLLDSSTWTIGSGSVTGFIRYGTDDENTRELGTDPYGNQSILWRGTPDGTTTGSNGGWHTFDISIDPSKDYRFTVWMKKNNSFDGNTVLSAYARDSNSSHKALTLDGTPSSNPIFEARDVPELDRWYLYVGYIYHIGYTGTTHNGGVYDGVTGAKVFEATDFKFDTGATTVTHRAYLWSGENPSDNLYLYAPTIYEVNGQEPTIQELLNGPNGGSDTQAPTVPNLSSSGHTDSTVDLSWSGATDNVGVTGYIVYQDNVVLANNITSTTYQVTGLSAATAYNFKVRALDAAGNESGDSNIVSVTTTSGSGGGSGSTSSIWSESGSTASYSGEVAIGRASVPSGYKLAVDGHIRTREIRVDQDTWPDYVFEEGYDLPTLEEIQKHIEEKGHLPNIPSAKEVESNGLELGEMNKLLLEKIEEQMLYILQQQEDIKFLKQENNKQSLLIEKLLSKTP